jgi:hypothetical protein
LLRAGAALGGSVTFAGCTGSFETRLVGIPPIPEDRPDAIYIPSHVEGMKTSGMTRQGDYAFGLMYSYAHRFWNVSGDSVSLTEIADEDDVHLMASVWDPETMTILPDTGLSAEICRGDSLVSQETIYPMLPEPMGSHHGANFGQNGDGEYAVKPSVCAMSTRRSGAFQDRFSEPATVEVPFEYSQQAKEEIMLKLMEDETATPGAVDPMEMEVMPDSLAPSESDLPGTIIGSGMSNDAKFGAVVLDTLPSGIDGDGQYVAVSARSRFNRMIPLAMGLEGTLSSGSEILFEGEFTRALDPYLNYYYGAVVDGVEPGDELSLRVTVQPQTTRHKGYETALWCPHRWNTGRDHHCRVTKKRRHHGRNTRSFVPPTSHRSTYQIPPQASATLAGTYVLVILGAYTGAIGASLSCPYWPKCYGTVVPSLRLEIIASSPSQLESLRRVTNSYRDSRDLSGYRSASTTVSLT